MDRAGGEGGVRWLKHKTISFASLPDLGNLDNHTYYNHGRQCKHQYVVDNECDKHTRSVIIVKICGAKIRKQKILRYLLRWRLCYMQYSNDILLRRPFCLSRLKYDSRVYVVFVVFAYLDCPLDLWHAYVGGNVVYIMSVAWITVVVIAREKIVTCVYQDDRTSGRLSRWGPVHTIQPCAVDDGCHNT